MSDSLSQNQAENLLRAVNSPDESMHDRVARSPAALADNEPSSFRIDGAHSSSAHSSSAHSSSAHASSRNVTRESVDSVAQRPASEPVVQPYDFRRPPQLRRNQIQALHILSDVIAMQFSRSAATLMRGEIDCQLVSVDQCCHQEFVCQLDDPSCFCVIDPNPLSGHWMLDIPSPLLFAMVDRMLGGEPHPGDTPDRPMTEIEKSLIGRVIETFLANVGEAWQRVLEIKPTIKSIDNHPHCVAGTSINESIVRVRYSATICNVRSEFQFAIPVSTIDHLSDRMDPQSWESELSKTPTPETRNTITNQLADAPVRVVVNLAKSTISTRDLLGLSVGDVIATEKQVSEPMELAISDVPKFQVRAGSYQQKVAVQVVGSAPSK